MKLHTTIKRDKSGVKKPAVPKKKIVGFKRPNKKAPRVVTKDADFDAAAQSLQTGAFAMAKPTLEQLMDQKKKKTAPKKKKGKKTAVAAGETEVETTMEGGEDSQSAMDSYKPEGWKSIDIGEGHLSSFDHSGFIGLEVFDADSYVTQEDPTTKRKRNQEESDDEYSDISDVEDVTGNGGRPGAPKKTKKQKNEERKKLDKKKQKQDKKDKKKEKRNKANEAKAEGSAPLTKKEKQEAKEAAEKNKKDLKIKVNNDKMEKIKQRNEKALQKVLTNDEQSNVDVAEWEKYNLDPLIIKGIKSLGFGKPTQIQSEVIPLAVGQGYDIIGAAETGSGKTLAFGIPMVHNILTYLRSVGQSVEKKEDVVVQKKNKKQVAVEKDGDEEEEEEEDEEEKKQKKYMHSLILCPTRELAIQVANHLKSVSNQTCLRIVTIVGGMATQKQERQLRSRPEIVVATPGRLWELIQEGNEHLIDLSHLLCFGVDEADRMVEKGHFQELTSILNLLPKYKRNTTNEEESKENVIEADDSDNETDLNTKSTSHKRQTFVFSATLVGIPDITKLDNKKTAGLTKKKKGAAKTPTTPLEDLIERVKFHRKHRLVDCTHSKMTANTLHETKIVCNLEDRDVYLYYFVDRYPGRTLVFVNSIDAARRLLPILTNLKVPVYALHAQMQQKQRLKNLDRFRDLDNVVLIATDVAARGLDIPNVQHVLHFQVPRSLELYIHRSGRTARSNKEGISLIFVTPKEQQMYARLDKALEHPIDTFPIEVRYLPAIRDRVDLAIQIDKMTHAVVKVAKEKSWFQKTAEEMDIELGDEYYDDDSEEEFIDMSKRTNKLNALKNDLDHLLSSNILPKGTSTRYITSTGLTELSKKAASNATTDLQVKIARRKLNRK
eukprot:gene13841-16320_t